MLESRLDFERKALTIGFVGNEKDDFGQIVVEFWSNPGQILVSGIMTLEITANLVLFDFWYLYILHSLLRFKVAKPTKAEAYSKTRE